jgi:hypothetical protein
MIVLKDINLARNPVARAIAKQQLKQAMLDMRIALLMMDEGDSCREHMLTISDSIFVVAAAYEIMEWKDSLNFRKLRSAMNIMAECSETGFKWKKEWAITIDNAIDICAENWTKIPSTIFQQAMKQILG